MESFDAFLIQLPREMKTNDCPINKNKNTSSINMPSIEPSIEPNIEPNTVQSIEPSHPLKMAKRKRPNSYRPCSESEQSANSGFEKRKRSNAHTNPSMIQIVTSKSKNSSSLSKSVTQISQKLSVQKIVSKVTQKSSSSSFVMYQNAKSNDRTFRFLNSQQKRIASSQYPKVLIPKIQVNQNPPMTVKSVHFKSNAEVFPNDVKNGSRALVVHKENVLPKRVSVRRKAIDELHPKYNGKLAHDSNHQPLTEQLNVDLSSHLALTIRCSPRARRTNNYRCHCCDYSSNVRNNFERHQLIHKQ